MLANVFLDNGNGNEKAKSDTKEVIYPNRLKVYDENPLHTNLLSNSNKRETVYEVNGKKYVVDQNGMGSGSRNENRYETDLYYAEAMIAISKVTEKEKISLGFALPAEHYKDDEIVSKVKQRFLNEHEILVDGVRHKFNVDSVYVLPQAYLCLVDYILEDDFSIRNDKHKNTYLCIDIGAGTLDIVTTNGLKITSADGGNIGSMDFNKKYLARIKNNPMVVSDKAKFTIDDIDFIPQKIFRKREKQYDFTKEYEETCKELADQVSYYLNKNGIDFSDYDRILYCGGTTLLIQDHLYLPNNAKIYPDSIMGNVRGGQKFVAYRNSMNKGGQK